MPFENELDRRSITVRTFKYDGTAHRHWSGHISRIAGSLIVLDAVFDEEIKHPLLGTVASQTLSTEYYWLDRWYNVFRFVEPAGGLRNFYCNVTVPPVLSGSTLSYIDLDVDVLVAPDLTYDILDEDEFAANADLFNYPLEIRSRTQEALAQLIKMIGERAFPFDDLK
jgi:uncharacterized protein